MTQTKTRLIALIDFSLYSSALLELAGRWCQNAGANLLLIHKVAGLVPGLAESDMKKKIIDDEKKEAIDKLKKLASEKIAPETKVDFVATDKSILEAISDALDEGLNDYIIVGIKGTGMLKRILMGSVATHVINELNNITITVPEKLCVGPGPICNLTPRKIVVTLTDKYPLNEAALGNFLETFEGTIKKLTFVSVVDEDEDAREETEFLSNLTGKYRQRFDASYKILRGNNVFEEIKENVQGDSDTVLVVQKGSRTLTDQFFRKFFINQLVSDGSLPMVVLPV